MTKAELKEKLMKLFIEKELLFDDLMEYYGDHNDDFEMCYSQGVKAIKAKEHLLLNNCGLSDEDVRDVCNSITKDEISDVYLEFMYNMDNEHNYSKCPNNDGYDS